MWEHEIIEFKNYLKLERSLSNNSVAAYVNDINKLISFILKKNLGEIKYSDVNSDLLKDFIEDLYNSDTSS